MVTQSWMYDVIIYLYALSLLFFFSDLVNNQKSANRIGFWFLTAVWVTQTVFFVLRMFEIQYLPIFTLFESMFLYSWILVTLSLVISYFSKIDLLVFFTNIVGFAVLALNFFTNKNVLPISDRHEFTSELLFIHISLSFLSYAAFSIATVLSLMYFLQNRMLKAKRWNPFLRRLPSLEQLDRIVYRLVIVGIPLLVSGMVLGVIWAYLNVVANFWLDPKVVTSVLVLLVYSVYLWQRTSFRWSGEKLAKWNVIAFITIVINFVISNTLSSFHQWM